MRAVIPAPVPSLDLALAAYPNVWVKERPCTLSREPFPYDDIWDPVLRIIPLHVGYRLDTHQRKVDL